MQHLANLHLCMVRVSFGTDSSLCASAANAQALIAASCILPIGFYDGGGVARRYRRRDRQHSLQQQQMLSRARYFPTGTCQVSHGVFQTSMSRVQTANTISLPWAPALCTAIPLTATALLARQLRRPPGRLIATHAGMKQQQYWRALEEFAAQDEEVWHMRLREAGIQPLTKARQYTR